MKGFVLLFFRKVIKSENLERYFLNIENHREHEIEKENYKPIIQIFLLYQKFAD